jgi:hypothetical protein
MFEKEDEKSPSCSTYYICKRNPTNIRWKCAWNLSNSELETFWKVLQCSCVCFSPTSIWHQHRLHTQAVYTSIFNIYRIIDTHCWTVGRRVSALQSRKLTGRESLKRRQVRPRIWMPPPQIWDDDEDVSGGLAEVKAAFGPVSTRMAGEMGELARHALQGDGCHLYLNILKLPKLNIQLLSYFFSFLLASYTDILLFYRINQEKLVVNKLKQYCTVSWSWH